MTNTVEKALQLINLVGDADRSLQELARASGFSRSTTHRLASLLVKHRYLDSVDQRYTLGYRLLELGERKKAGLQITKTARPIVHAYSELTGETVHLAVLDGTHIIIVEKVVGSRQLQVNSYVGLRTPAYKTGVGKALISAQPEQEWPHFLQGLGEDVQARLVEDLRKICVAGHAFDLEESNAGVCCVATVIRGPERQAVAAVSFNGAKVYLSPERLHALAPTIRACATEIEEALAVGSHRERQPSSMAPT